MTEGKFRAQPISKKVITWAEYEANGCPVCNTGTKEGYLLVRGSGFALVACAHCGVAYEVNDKKAAEQADAA